MNLLPHNEPVYLDLINNYKNNNKKNVCIVMGTGVGKSYVALEYVQSLGLRPLIVTPRVSISDSWAKLIPGCETLTYQKLARIYKNIDYSNYDVLICDEVHHIGAKIWGQAIRYIIDNDLIKVIGLTESPIRYTDGGRDIALEFFDGNVIYGEDVPSAISKGILNPVTYVGAMYNSEGLAHTLRGKIQNRLYAKLNLVINQTPTVSEIVRGNMPSGKRKGIIFASTVDDIEYAARFMHSIYPNVEIRYVHSKQSDAINEKNFEWFRSVKEGYLCSVDMISEGVHIKGVNTLIMLRRTESVNLFNQQLGRCLDASSREPAIVFDLVNNKYTVHVVKNKLRIRINNNLGSGHINIRQSEQMIIKDYTQSVVDCLREIKESIERKCLLWTDEEKEILREYWPTEFQKVADRLPRHTGLGCKAMAAVLGLTVAKNIYTESENEFLRNNYKKMSLRELASSLNRSEGSVSSQLKKIKVVEPINFWSQEEDDLIRKLYPKQGRSLVLPGRTKDAIRTRAKLLGIKYTRNDLFSSSEIEFVKNNYIKMGPTAIGKALNRDERAIQNLVSRKFPELKGKGVNISNPWTDEEIDVVRKYYPTEGQKMSWRLPHRTTEAIIYIAKKKKIRKIVHSREK